MRAIFLILGLVALATVAAMHFGLVSFDQMRPLVVQAPKFEADVARVSVGTEKRTVRVPDIDVQPAGNEQR